MVKDDKGYYMRELIINKDNLKPHDIQETVTRVKALMINEQNEILLAYCDDDYQFPGGHLNEGEDVYEGLIREVKEETGIESNKDDYYLFMVTKHYEKSYFRTGNNRLNIMIYFIYKKVPVIDDSNIDISNYERKNGFRLCYVNIDDVEDLLIDHTRKFPRFKDIAYEMLPVLDEYKNNYYNNTFESDDFKL